MPRLCNYCDERTANHQCAGCFKAWYCSKACQRKAWGSHKSSCNPKNGLSTADHLRSACFADLLPVHKQTLIDFGFERAFSNENKSHLLGVYQYLMKIREIPAKTVHRWRKRGILLQEIQKAYDPIPIAHRKAYYIWLMDHQWVFDGKTPEEWGQKQAEADFRAQIARAGWVYSGGSQDATDSQIQECAKTWSTEMNACLRLCGGLLNRIMPGPDSDLWISFAFCTCHPGSDQKLARLYTKLIGLCTFEEFLVAYETSQLYSLFASKGLAASLEISHPLVRGVLKTSPTRNLTVWDLKRFILQDPEDNLTPSFQRPINSVMVDYGFDNCTSISEMEDLKAVYKTLFEAYSCQPPDLHFACISGRLFDYVSQWVKLKGKEKYQRLMANSYPLSRYLDSASDPDTGVSTRSTRTRDPDSDSDPDIGASTRTRDNTYIHVKINYMEFFCACGGYAFEHENGDYSNDPDSEVMDDSSILSFEAENNYLMPGSDEPLLSASSEDGEDPHTSEPASEDEDNSLWYTIFGPAIAVAAHYTISRAFRA